MNEPAMPATWLVPSARPRCSGGNASVRMAEELANSSAPPHSLQDPHDDQPQGAGHPGHPVG